jgi:hypothetical protein
MGSLTTKGDTAKENGFCCALWLVCETVFCRIWNCLRERQRCSSPWGIPAYQSTSTTFRSILGQFVLELCILWREYCWLILTETVGACSGTFFSMERALLSYTDRNRSHFVLSIIDWQSLRLWFLHSAKGSQGSVLERPGGEWLACARRGSQAYCNRGFHPPLKLKCWFFVPHFPWSNYDASSMHMLQLSNFFALLRVNRTS